MRSGAVHGLCPISAALLLLFYGCGGADNHVLEEAVEKVYPIEPDAAISIQSRDGAVLVYGGESNQVWVRWLKRAYSQERLREIAVDVSTKPGAVSVMAKFPPQRKWAFSDHSGTVDCTIVVPATATISGLELNAGEILLDSLRGPEVHARLNDGRIFARNCFANLDLAMKRGSLTLTYGWWEQEKFSARVNLEQGNAWVFLPTEAAFHLVAYALHGKIANDFNNVPLTGKSSAQEMKVDQIVNGGGAATINVRVEKGDIKIGEANP